MWNVCAYKIAILENSNLCNSTIQLHLMFMMLTDDWIVQGIFLVLSLQSQLPILKELHVAAVKREKQWARLPHHFVAVWVGFQWTFCYLILKWRAKVGVSYFECAQLTTSLMSILDSMGMVCPEYFWTRWKPMPPALKDIGYSLGLWHSYKQGRQIQSLRWPTQSGRCLILGLQSLIQPLSHGKQWWNNIVVVVGLHHVMCCICTGTYWWLIRI